MLSKLAVRRLTKLADYMDGLPKDAHAHFEMGEWVLHNGESSIGDIHGLKNRGHVKKEHLVECGMVACAMGWAATIQAFAKAGLLLRIGPRYPGSSHLIAYPSYKRKTGFEAAESFFDLTHTQSEDLFGVDVDVRTQAEWAKHCRKFLRDNA